MNIEKYEENIKNWKPENEEEVKEKRRKLNSIQKYYEHNGSYIMRNIKVDELSNNEVEDMYEQIYNGIGSQSFDNMVREGNNIIEEQEKNKRLDPIRERVAKYRTSTGVGDVSNPSTNEVPESQVIEQTETERKTKNLKKNFEKINKDIEKINAKLILGENLTNEINEEIKNIDKDVKELANTAQEIISDMDNFKDKYEQVEFSMNYQEITNELKKIKNKLKKLKQEQIKKYNNSIEATNKAIEELRALNDPEINSKLDTLEPLTKCSANVTQWNGSIKYLNEIDYNKLINANRILSEIHNDKTKEDLEENKDNEWSNTMLELYTDIEKIEDEINRIETEFKENMTKEDIDRLRQDIMICSDSVNSFRAKLDNNKDKIDKEEFNKLEERWNNAQDELMDLNTVLNTKGLDEANISVDKKSVYDELMERINILKGSLEDLENLSLSLAGLMNKETVDAYRNLLNNKHILELNAIEEDIENMNKNGKLNLDQYNNLKKELENIKTLVKSLNDKLRDPGMIKDVDIFSILDGEIDGLEKALDTLETMIESSDKKIKRAQRKEIDKNIKHLETEHKRLTKLAEQYKESNPEKYNKTIERLNNVDSRLNTLKKDYRKKCPLLVRGIKSAKEFYKKHKKIILIAAGLTAFALIAHHVLIPAIIHGNMQIWQWAPESRDTIEFLNKLLGRIGGLTHSGNAWFTASGVMLNGTVATSSLLKGLAISGINTVALVVPPLIIAIKELMKKMNMAELKAKLQEEQKKAAEKIKNKANEAKEKSKEKKVKNKANSSSKKADKLTIEELAKLFKEYRNSGLSLEEFVEQMELTEEEKQVLQYLETNSKENKKGGRR